MAAAGGPDAPDAAGGGIVARRQGGPVAIVRRSTASCAADPQPPATRSVRTALLDGAEPTSSSIPRDVSKPRTQRGSNAGVAHEKVRMPRLSSCPTDPHLPGSALKLRCRSFDGRRCRSAAGLRWSAAQVRLIVGRSHSPPNPPLGGFRPHRSHGLRAGGAATTLLRSSGRKLPPSLRRSGPSDGVGCGLNTRRSLPVV